MTICLSCGATETDTGGHILHRTGCRASWPAITTEVAGNVYAPVPVQVGLSRDGLRDLFAAAALVALTHNTPFPLSDIGEWARDAYALADAMLKAREPAP